MSEAKLEFVNKPVKDMYGSSIGKAVGITTDIDGAIENIGVDCGLLGLKQFPYEQLLIQGDYIIHIPRWRLDAQKLLRQKNLTFKRIKAIHEIIADNDLLKEDAELIYIKYEKKLQELNSITKEVNEKLEQRLMDLENETKNVRIVLLDAKLQYRSNEITEEAYQQIYTQTNEILEHINLESTEINNIKLRLSQQTLENTNANNINTISTLTDTKINDSIEESITIEDRVEDPQSENPQILTANNGSLANVNNSSEEPGERRESTWLNQVIN